MQTLGSPNHVNNSGSFITFKEEEEEVQTGDLNLMGERVKEDDNDIIPYEKPIKFHLDDIIGTYEMTSGWNCSEKVTWRMGGSHTWVTTTIRIRVKKNGEFYLGELTAMTSDKKCCGRTVRVFSGFTLGRPCFKVKIDPKYNPASPDFDPGIINDRLYTGIRFRWIHNTDGSISGPKETTTTVYYIPSAKTIAVDDSILGRFKRVGP